MKIKTTYLFKFPGAWSPLWNLSDEKFFEIKSKEFWSNFCCQIIPPSDSLTMTMQTFQETVEKMMAIAVGFEPQISKKQMKIFNQPQIVFSEYHDPINFGCTVDTGVTDCQNIGSIMIRADEIFGSDNHSPERADFIEAMLNHSAVMVRRTNFHCRITPL